MAGSDARPRGRAETNLVALVASIGAQTYQVTAGGVAMNAGPTAGPADGTNGFVRSFYLLEFELPTAGSIAIVVNPNAAAARGAVGAWSLIGAQQTALGALRSAADVHATGPTTTVSLAAVPAGAAILSGFVNNTSGTASLGCWRGNRERQFRRRRWHRQPGFRVQYGNCGWHHHPYLHEPWRRGFLHCSAHGRDPAWRWWRTVRLLGLS